MATLQNAIYTEVEPATDTHGTQVVARMAHMRATAPYPHELSDWAEIHAVGVAALLALRSNHVGVSNWIPALFGAGVVWVNAAEQSYQFTK